MNFGRRIIAVVALLGFWAAAANAQTVIWDQGPATGTNGGGFWTNDTNGQNFADNVQFGVDTLVGGFNLFTGWDLRNYTGTADFHVKILADNAGAPGSVIWQWDQGYSSLTMNVAPELNMASFTFGPKLFAANTTYWVGVSGNSLITQASVVAPGDGRMAQFAGAEYQHMAGVGDQMFQLTAPVPETETYAMLLAGLGVLGAVTRRRRSRQQ